MTTRINGVKAHSRGADQPSSRPSSYLDYRNPQSSSFILDTYEKDY